MPARIAQHDDRPVEDDLRGVSPAHVVGTDEATISVKVTPVLICGPVVCAVVLMDGAGAIEEQVGTGDETARAVEDADLGADVNPEDEMEEPKQRLPGGLAAAVGGRESRPERRRSLPPWSRSPFHVVVGAQPQMKGGVDQDHKIEDPEPASTGQQRVGDWGDGKSLDDRSRRGAGVATHQQATPVGLDLPAD